MALIEQVKEIVRDTVHVLLGDVIRQLDEIRERLETLEDQTGPATAVPAKKATAAPASSRASAGNISGK